MPYDPRRVVELHPDPADPLHHQQSGRFITGQANRNDYRALPKMSVDAEPQDDGRAPGCQCSMPNPRCCGASFNPLDKPGELYAVDGVDVDATIGVQAAALHAAQQQANADPVANAVAVASLLGTAQNEAIAQLQAEVQQLRGYLGELMYPAPEDGAA